MMHDEILKRDIPSLGYPRAAQDVPAWRRDTIDLFSRLEYGYTPAFTGAVRAEAKRCGDDWGGKAEHDIVTLSFDTPSGEFSFNAHTLIPAGAKKAPAFLYISFTPYPFAYETPLEEIIDNGYAVAGFCYNDVTKDTNDGFTSGIASMYPRRGNGTDWGKIGMWAFAASRLLDYVLTLPGIDPARVYVIGHSRLGKTALWCAAQDERFAGAVSNDSGCSGAAITRGKAGERVADITADFRFPYWFCPNYLAYRDNERAMPFDQHYLLALIAPRPLAVGSATRDEWADPESEFMSSILASEAWTAQGKTGLVADTSRLPEPGAELPDGMIGYHLRNGTHFLGREDWTAYIRFFNRHS